MLNWGPSGHSLNCFTKLQQSLETLISRENTKPVFPNTDI